MGRFDTTKATINANIKKNGNQEITGSILNSVMTEMVDATDAELAKLSASTKTYASSGYGTPVIVSAPDLLSVNDSMDFLVRMRYEYDSAGDAQLKVGYADAKPIYWRGKPANISNSWGRNELVSVRYSSTDGCYYATPFDWSQIIYSAASAIGIIEGYYIQGNDVIANSGYNVTDYIEVTPGQRYVSNYNHRLYFYNKNKVAVGTFITSQEFEVPSECYFVRFSMNKDITYPTIAHADGRGMARTSGLVTEYISEYDELNTGLVWNIAGYLDKSTGEIISDSSYVTSDYIGLRKDAQYYAKGLRIAFYDANGVFMSFIDSPNGLISIPDDAVLCRLSTAVASQQSAYFYGNKSNIVTIKDIAESSSLYKTDLHCAMTPGAIDKDINVLGMPGQPSAIYSIPLANNGTYALQFRFKFPRNIQTNASKVTLASFGDPETNVVGTKGGFFIELIPMQPSANAPYQQPKYNAGIAFYPSHNTGNNYKAHYIPNGLSEKPFVSEDLFSIQYVGNAINGSDLVLSINDSGLVVQHSSTSAVELRVNFPSNKSYRAFLSLIESACNNNGQFKFTPLNQDMESTDDIIRISNVPLVGSYSRTSGTELDAFPCYVQGIDNEWHTIDVRFNKNGTNVVENADWQEYPDKGSSILSFFYDGRECTCVDNRFPLVGEGVFKGRLKLGGEGIIIKDVHFKQVPEIDSPIILNLFAHSLNLQTLEEAKNNKIGLSTMQYIVASMHRHGFEFVPLTAIRDYFVNNKSLPNRKVWTMMHDDTFFADGVNEGYYANGSQEASKAFRSFYMANGIKASFPMISSYYTGDRSDLADRCVRDLDIFEFSIHSSVAFDDVSYEDIKRNIKVETQTLSEKIRTTNIFTYNQGRYDYNTIHVLSEFGIALANTISDTYLKKAKTGASKAYHNLAQARLSVDNNNFNVEIFEQMMSYYDSL